MTKKQTNPKKEDVIESKDEKNTSPAPKTKAEKDESSVKRSVNLFFVVILLTLGAGFYVYQKGYIPANIFKTTLNKGETPLLNMIEETDSKEADPPVVTPNNNEKNQAQFVQLQNRIEDIERTITVLKNQNERLQQIKSNASNTKLIFSFMDLKENVQQGMPYASELNALSGVIDSMDPIVLDPLKEFAVIGVPSHQSLTHEFAEIAHAINEKTKYDHAEGYLDKTLIFLSSLVSFEKVGASAKASQKHGDRLMRLLKNGDIERVLTDPQFQDVSSDTKDLFLIHATATLRAQKALMDLKEKIIAELP